ncbi:phosphatase PAP2 family protein [Jatrophihabitans fulvus]
MRRLQVGAAGAAVLFVLDLVLVTSRWGPLRRFDVDASATLSGETAGHPALVTFWKAVSAVGQPAVFQAVAVAVGVALRLRGRRSLALYCAVTVPVASSLSTLVKLAVRRDRPAVADDLTHAAGASFPSGHATTSMAGVLVLLIVLSRLRRGPLLAAAVVLGAAIAVVVAASRLWLGVHYPTDVAGGWLLATTWVLVATVVLQRVSDRRPPTAAPDPPPAVPAA